jgi:ACS family hexuronate transporter-like MFS transporter
MGNSVLQSGASIGAVLTPLIMRAMLTPELGSWRPAFLVIGAAGVLWIFFWLMMVRDVDLRSVPAVTAQASPDPTPGASFWQIVFSRRFLLLCVIVACINTCWQLLRAWLPKFLQEGRGYSESNALYFNSLYYVATDIGCLGAGALTLWLNRRGLSVHGSRSLVFLLCAMLIALTTVVAFLPKGWLMLAVLLIVGMGALGVFPCYYSWSQELTTRHQGKITGLTGVAAWALSPAHKYFGRLVDQTGSFDLGLAIIGWAPLLGFVVFWLFWDEPRRKAHIDARG